MNHANETNPASNDAFKSNFTHSSTLPSQFQRFFLPSLASTAAAKPTSVSTAALSLLSHPLTVSSSSTSKHGLNVSNSTTNLKLPTDLQARLEQVQKSIVKATPIQPLQPQVATRPNSMVYDFKMKKKSAKRIMVSYDQLLDFETTTLCDTWYFDGRFHV
jgi:TolA-binding protein